MGIEGKGRKRRKLEEVYDKGSGRHKGSRVFLGENKRGLIRLITEMTMTMAKTLDYTQNDSRNIHMH